MGKRNAAKLLILGDAISESVVATHAGRDEVDEEHITFPSGVWLVRSMIFMYLNGVIRAKAFPGSHRLPIDGRKPLKPQDIADWLVTYNYDDLKDALRNHAWKLSSYKRSPTSSEEVFRVKQSKGWLHHIQPTRLLGI